MYIEGKINEMDVNKFLERIYQLVYLEKIEAAVDTIFDQIQYLMDIGRTDLCDILLGHAEPNKLQTDSIVAFLTTTKTLKTENRHIFIEKAKIRIGEIKGKEYAEEILKKY